MNLAVEQQSGVPIIIGQKNSGQLNRHQTQPTNSYQNSNNNAPIELYSAPQPYKVPVTTSKAPPSRQTTKNSDVQVITKEIRLTPDPFEVTVPISVPDDQVSFPEPSYPRR